MSSFNIINLAEAGPVDLGQHLDGGWGPARLIDLDTGGREDLDAAGGEICIFVIQGAGAITMGENTARLETGVGVTLMQGSTSTVTAEQTMQLFAAWLIA